MNGEYRKPKKTYDLQDNHRFGAEKILNMPISEEMLYRIRGLARWQWQVNRLLVDDKNAMSTMCNIYCGENIG